MVRLRYGVDRRNAYRNAACWDLYEQEEYDLFLHDGKAPVGQGKLMM